MSLIASAVMVGQAEAACTRLAFSVNDYGKIGPTNDAKRLLDQHIASEMSKRGVSNYKTGTKSVSCELFLDFVVFDEYTCRAEATVCWGGSTPSAAPVEASNKKSEDAAEKKSISTGSIDKASDDATEIESAPAPVAKKAPVVEKDPNADVPAKSQENDLVEPISPSNVDP